MPTPEQAQVPTNVERAAETEMPRYEPPPQRVDVTKPGRTRPVDDVPRGGRSKPSKAAAKGAASSANSAPPSADSLPENGSLLDDRK
jgi:hypothetical protein